MAFKDIPGNPGVKKILQSALRNGRLPHALLFCGPAGVYKRRTAFTLAQALNCRRSTDDACGDCESCRAIKRSEETGQTWHPDIQELAVENQTDRFTLAMDAIDRIPRLRVSAAGIRDELANERIACQQYAFEHGIDRPDITGWKSPF